MKIIFLSMAAVVLYPAHVVGIAIRGYKGVNPLKETEFFSIKYSKDTVKQQYTSGYNYELHCKIFNPGYP